MLQFLSPQWEREHFFLRVALALQISCAFVTVRPPAIENQQRRWLPKRTELGEEEEKKKTRSGDSEHLWSYTPTNPFATHRLEDMSTAGEVPAFFQRMGSDSPARPRQKFCGVFCPVEGSSDSKTLDFDALSACRGKSDGRVIDRQTDISQPRKVEIRESTGKEALQNLDDKRVISLYFACWLCVLIFISLSQSSFFCLSFSTFSTLALISSM